MAIEVLTKAQGWDAEKQQGWRGQGEQQVLDHVDRKHGIHPKDIHQYHERDEDDTDSQDESFMRALLICSPTARFCTSSLSGPHCTCI